jgi:cytochrome oxidase Cu insertion factor (SCO1/SenC/PrrC family)
MQHITVKPISAPCLAGVGLSAWLVCAAASAQMAMGDHAAHMGAAMPGADATSEIVVDFELVDRDGNTVTDEDFRGRHILLGFGFTHCEHICPLMGLHMGQAVEAANVPVTGIFVSVDTERDTAAINDDYARHFGDAMLGLGGSIEQINAATKNFRVSYAVTKTQDAYTVQHTANIFLIDPAGQLAEVFPFTATPDDIVEALR